MTSKHKKNKVPANGGHLKYVLKILSTLSRNSQGKIRISYHSLEVLKYLAKINPMARYKLKVLGQLSDEGQRLCHSQEKASCTEQGRGKKNTRSACIGSGKTTDSQRN